ncbi:Ankyrin repeat and SAM domain-containing protein 6 [Tolypocladium ophioglossoides CBS 100239]|uniref:Ankyrin repeat and SAM domain-containing protein 6 n=1 Tax=Tolypocladium ophioglossoides (strain CBS 100239) TaxID=1163406 RepID=A0A0L0MYA9_TOLOC|nr:Ankyrin repeat and SAM domain-containing protein 6 [Tolypocladium ophioglossoides CBS 100239]
MTSRKTLDSPDAYAVAWIAALPIERAAAEAMLDEEHGPPTGFVRPQTDTNVYTWGRMGEHNIVIASLAAGMLEKNPKMGKKSKKSPGFAHQGVENDRLFRASCTHVLGPDCRSCDAAGEIQRDPRDTSDPEIHYGIIASGNTLLLVEQKIVGVERIAAATKATIDNIKSDGHIRKIERWLCPPDPSTNANHARELRHEGTGRWLLDSPVFQSWHSGSHRHLWLYGLAGCGKTVLSSTVLDHLAETTDRPVLSFFFDFSDTTKQTTDGMLRSLAFQLSQSSAASISHLDALFQAHQDGGKKPATKALSDVVYKMLTNYKSIFVVLDALDESMTRAELLSWIRGITSRPELLHHAINADIRSYVAAELAHRPDFRNKVLSHDTLERIQSKVGDGADGMFRWAFCQLDTLARCRHNVAIEKALTCLLRDLYETYRRMLESIPSDVKSDAIRLLQFLVHSKRPLRLDEAIEVIATDIEDQSTGFDVDRRLFYQTDILYYCLGLVTVIRAANEELHLSHFSVKEYLVTNNQLKLPTASISITRTCLVYLTDIHGSYAEMKQNFPMARFAAEVWVGFAALAEASEGAASVKAFEGILQATIKFLQEESTFQRWCRLYQQDREWDNDSGPARGTRLYYACLGGLYRTARQLLDEGWDPNAQGSDHGSALQAASTAGHGEIVKLLLEKVADVNAQGGSCGNALQVASATGHGEIVKLLLDKGADVNAQGGIYGNALQAVSAGGHGEIVKLL